MIDMWALVDCNSFFCSVEKVFHPGLRNKPVVVLSNNDGCIVALTPEAKRIGLHRGDPLFRVRDIVEVNGVAVFSTNMPLYAAMSKRVTNILRQSVMRVENYSIDESFCNLDGYAQHYDLEEFMRAVAERIALWTDIPVSIGIAPSKTIAKMGSKFAKQYKGYRGVCSIDTDEKRRKALGLFPLDDVWGIGRHTLEKLNYYGVRSPLELADKSEAWVRQRLAKPGVQTWMELNGIPCIDTAEIVRNQTICTSRSFGEMVSDLPSLKAAVAHFATSCAGKLRGQNATCRQVTAFVSSNRFREDLPQYGNSASIALLMPTADTIEIVRAALRALDSIYQKGILYKKAGVVVSDICDAGCLQGDLFDPVPNRRERADLMERIDSLNRSYGPGRVRLAVEAAARPPAERKQPLGAAGAAEQRGACPDRDAQPDAWRPLCEHRSGNYLTNIRELLTV